MILVKDGQYKIEGSTQKLLAELTQLLRVFYAEEILDEERTTMLPRLAKVSEEELRSEAQEILAKKDTLTRLFGDLLEGEDQ